MAEQDSFLKCYQTETESFCSASLPSEARSSTFGESQLGEPLVSQRLVLDFTPMEDMDNEVAQKKCCAFWDFVKSRTDLQHMLVLPDEKILTNKTTDESAFTDSDFMPIPINRQQKTAVSMLEIVEGKGLIDRIFEAKLQQTDCSLGSREYLLDESTESVHATAKTAACTCSRICKACRDASKQSRGAANGASSPGVQTLCRKLHTWDTEHPKYK